MTARVDVLAVMDRNAEQARETRAHYEWSLDHAEEADAQDREARAAVAELIEKSAAGFDDLRAMIAAADRGEVWIVNAGTRLRLDAFAAALARVQP